MSATIVSFLSSGPAQNRAIGFTSMLIGVLTGMVLGLWSFGGPIPVPETIGAYDDLARRFLRLGHIAFFGLGIINIAIAGHAGSLGFSRSRRTRVLVFMNLGNLVLPPLLLAAAFVPPLLYALPLPVLCVLFALGLTSVQAWTTAAKIQSSINTQQGEPG